MKKNFNGQLERPTTELAGGDLLRFTHIETSGNVPAGSQSLYLINNDGTYNFDLNYGLILIEVKYRGKSDFFKLRTCRIDDSVTTNSLTELIKSSFPVTPDTILTIEKILSDAELARDKSQEYSNDSEDSAIRSEQAAQISATASNIRGRFIPSETSAEAGDVWAYDDALWFALTDTSATPQESSGDWISLSKHNSTTERDEQGAHPVSAIDGALQYVDSIKTLLAVSPVDGLAVNVVSYHEGWAALLDTPYGGGVFVWYPGADKSEHDGGIVIDPGAPYPINWFDTNQQGTWFNHQGVGLGCWVRQFTGIYADEFGAVPNNSIPSSKAIIAAIGFAGKNNGVNFSSAYKTESKAVYIRSGQYLVTEQMDVEKNGINIVGLGRPSLIASSDLSNQQFILALNPETDNQKRPFFNKIKSIQFERQGSNPYRSNYISTQFGSGATYQFRDSCSGVYLGDSHYGELEDCSFIGLRCGVKSAGSWLFHFKGCNFLYNDRHMHCRASNSGLSSHNANVIEKCVFGASIMPAGVYLEGFDSLVLRDIDFENAHQNPYFFRQCRHVMSEGFLYTENNCVHLDNPSVPSYIFEPDDFMPVFSDVYSKIGIDYLYTFSACWNVQLNNVAHSQGNNEKGLVLNSLCHSDITLQNVRYHAKPMGYIFDNRGNTTTGFVVTNLTTGWFNRVVPDTRVPFKHYFQAGASAPNIACPTEWHIDPVNGSDETSTAEMSSSKPIKSLNVRAIPESSQQMFTVNVYSQGGQLTLPQAPSTRITVNGQQKAGSVAGISLGGVSLLTVTDLVLTDRLYARSYFGELEQGKYMNAWLTNCEAVYNQAPGFFANLIFGEVHLNNCEFTQNNAQNYVFVVHNGLDLWAKNCTFNKRVEVRDAGHYFHKGTTQPDPFMREDYMGVITQIP